ncbi:hypothetical protein SRABI96_04763 [Peribacillus sp. Bi96]|uniref:hypothetical protein n=1 Tax=Peribacillus sp. NPDC060253 TaxID=3347084 RepID=UPI001D4AEDA3|nr:hypothetical protein SRABI96_04763 [Peribacillus sp. Bi96]
MDAVLLNGVHTGHKAIQAVFWDNGVRVVVRGRRRVSVIMFMLEKQFNRRIIII